MPTLYRILGGNWWAGVSLLICRISIARFRRRIKAFCLEMYSLIACAGRDIHVLCKSSLAPAEERPGARQMLQIC